MANRYWVGGAGTWDTTTTTHWSASSGGTGGHIHAEISGAAGFNGRLSGPMSGYRPNVLMHGDEQISIRPMGRSAGADGTGSTDSAMYQLIERVDDLISVSKNQLRINERILKVQQ